MTFAKLQTCDLCDSPYVIERWQGHRRCEKHRGRLGCCIEGCGRTFALRDGETYHWVTMCGKHWRMGPKKVRDMVTLIRRRARKLVGDKREEWPEKLERQHHLFWEMNRRAVQRAVDGDINVADINRIMGWDEP